MFPKAETTERECRYRGAFVSILRNPKPRPGATHGGAERADHRICETIITEYFRMFQKPPFP